MVTRPHKSDMMDESRARASEVLLWLDPRPLSNKAVVWKGKTPTIDHDT